MHPAQEIIDAKISHQDGEKCKHKKQMHPAVVLEKTERNSMKTNGIHHKSYQRPSLFRVPTPISSPRNISPNRAEKNADAEQNFGGIEHYAAEDRELRKFFIILDEKRKNAIEKRERQKRIRNHNRGNVRAQNRRI